MTEYNAASRRHIREAEKEVKILEEQHAVVVASIMQHQGGRAWMFKKLEECHVYASSFTNNALSTAFREGERNVGLRLLTEIMAASPNNYILMMREADERNRASEQRRSKNGDRGAQIEFEYSDAGDISDEDDRDTNAPGGRNEVDYRS